MHAVLRAKAILIDPFAEWPRIAQESGDAVDLLSRYVAPLALIPALSEFIGRCLIGVVVPGIGTVRAPIFAGLLGAIVGYVLAFATVLLLGAIIHALAPLFGGRRNLPNALKLAVYSFTPVWLSGIFLLLPGLRFLTLTGLFYGAYLVVIGVLPLMKSPAEKSYSFAALIVACAGVLMLFTTLAQRALFGTAGL
jgi:hypothetical protein